MTNLGKLLEEYIISYPNEDTAIRMIKFFKKDPNCFEKDNHSGHFTGSAWVVNPDRSQILMTHHRKLDMWLQLGGHADGENDLISVAIREAKEESGFDNFKLVSRAIFDLDIHEIPAISKNHSHLHYDVRFLLEANPINNEIIISDESHDVRWIPLDMVLNLNPEESMHRMVKKTSALIK